MTHAQIGSRKG